MTSATADTPIIDSVAEGAEAEAAARSLLYEELTRALRFPEQPFYQTIVSGELRTRLGERVGLLPYTIDGAEQLLAAITVDGADGSGGSDGSDDSYDLFQSDYVGLFDVGAGGPPCALYGGAWGGDRQKVMEETLRFYRFFGLTISPEAHDLPDQLCTELEFLHFLAFKEVEALQAGGDAGSLRRACRDFLARHPARWLPKACAKLDEIDAPPLWRALVGLTSAYCNADAAYLRASEGPMKE